MRTISSTATPLPTAYDCVAVYIAGRRTNLVVYGCRPKPTTNKTMTHYPEKFGKNITNHISNICVKNHDCTINFCVFFRHSDSLVTDLEIGV